jgi:hypothetical protein
MNSCKPRVIYEKSQIIPIPQISPMNKEKETALNEYSLKENFFDPSKSSPPNDFLLKLELRMKHYNSFIKEDNFINE